MSVKSTAVKVLTGIAIGLGTAVFIIWKLWAHKRELTNAQVFLQEASNELQKEVLEGLEIKKAGFNEMAWALREEVESATKEDIIYAFEKAFGVSSRHSYKYRDSSDDNSECTGDDNTT